MSELPSAKKLADELVSRVRGHPLNCTGCSDAVSRTLQIYANDLLEAAAEVVKESGYIYGRESALVAIRRLKEDL